MENALSKEELKVRREEHEKELFMAKEDYERAKLELVYAIHVFNNRWPDLTMDDLDDENESRNEFLNDLNHIHSLSVDMNCKSISMSICRTNILMDNIDELLLNKK